MSKINYLFINKQGNIIFEYDGFYYSVYTQGEDIKIANMDKLIFSIDSYLSSVSHLRKISKYDLDKYKDLIDYVDKTFFDKIDEVSSTVEYKTKRRELLVEIFRNTEGFYKNEESLKESIIESLRGTKIYHENFRANERSIHNDVCKVIINSNRTLFEAREILKRDCNCKVAILNFANAYNGGGSVLKGSGSQEEAICRCSTLYPCIHVSDELLDGEYDDYFNYINEGYYAYNKRLNKASKRIIYTPDVMVFKEDIGYPTILNEKEWYKVNVISCAANNQNEVKQREKDAFEDINAKIRNVFEVSLDNHIDVLVLGAFGCGAFKNDPYVVAKAFLQNIKVYKQYFKEIHFAIYHTKKETLNYDIFKKVLKEFI